MSGIEINDALAINEDVLEWSFSRSSGPGGQNVNKVNSKATLRWSMTEDFLPLAARRRFLKLAKRYVTDDGAIVIQSQEYRDRPRNMQACRSKLQALLVQSLVAPKRRIATKPSKAAKQRRLNDKKLNSQRKQSRNFSD